MSATRFGIRRLRSRLRWWLHVMTLPSLIRWHWSQWRSKPGTRRTVAVTCPGIHHRRVYLRTHTSDFGTLLSTLKGWHRPEYPLPPGSVILDLGCNIGLTCLDLAQEHPDARVYGIELDAENYELALRNTRDIPRITIMHCGVTDHDGDVSYDAAGHPDSFSVLHESVGANTRTRRTAKGLTLKSLRDELNLSSVDFIKMDIEGAESRVLTSTMTRGTLAHVDQLSIEMHAGACSATICSVLQSCGFDVQRSRRRAWAMTALSDDWRRAGRTK